MNIGIISLIPWKFLRQRPQMFAEEFVGLGHNVYYIESLSPDDIKPDRLKQLGRLYAGFSGKRGRPDVNIIPGLMFPPNTKYRKYIWMNKVFSKLYSRIFKNMCLDFVIVLQPEYVDAVLSAGIPFAYDHVDDTQYYDGMWTERYIEKMDLLMRRSNFNIYIQEKEAQKDSKGVFIPNCADPNEFYPTESKKFFDAVVLSNIAKWFDMDSILQSKKKILLIGPMDLDRGDNYQKFRKAGKNNIFWIPKVDKDVAKNWVNTAEVGLVTFRGDHPLVQYAMPIKILEYFLCNLPVVTYFNEGIDHFYGDMVTFYSQNGSGHTLDEAIDIAKQKKLDYRSFAMRYQWRNIVKELEKRVFESTT